MLFSVDPFFTTMHCNGFHFDWSTAPNSIPMLYIYVFFRIWFIRGIEAIWTLQEARWSQAHLVCGALFLINWSTLPDQQLFSTSSCVLPELPSCDGSKYVCPDRKSSRLHPPRLHVSILCQNRTKHTHHWTRVGTNFRKNTAAVICFFLPKDPDAPVCAMCIGGVSINFVLTPV